MFPTQLINTFHSQGTVNSLSLTELFDLSLPFYLYPKNQIYENKHRFSPEQKKTTKTITTKKKTRKIYIQNNNSKI